MEKPNQESLSNLSPFEKLSVEMNFLNIASVNKIR